MSYDDYDAKVEDLKGTTIRAIIGMEKGSDEVRFELTDDRVLCMSHFQDCCESVHLDDVVGDPMDLIDSPVLVAEDVTSSSDIPPRNEDDYYTDSCTWTFYRFQTIKGGVTLRWLGQSNGYYSESVDLYWGEA